LNRLLAANLTLMVPVLAWGLPLPFMDQLFDRWDPVAASVLRYWLAAPLLWLIWRLTRRPGTPLRPPGIGWWPLVRLATLGLTAFSISYSYALDYMHPVTAAVLSATAPVISAVVARVLFRHPVARGLGIAIVLSLVGGVLCTVDFDAVGGASIELRGGEAILVISSVVWAWYSLEVQRLMPDVPQLQASMLTALPVVWVMPLIYALLLALGLARLPPPVEAWRADDLAVLVWFSVMAVAAAIVCWNLGVKLVGVVVASLYLNLVPVAAILAGLAIGVVPQPLQVVGGVIVLAGVVQAQLRLLQRRRARRTPAKASPP